MASEVIVPGGPEQLAADTALALVLAEQGSDHTAKHSQVLRSLSVLEPTVVLPEDHIQHPVQPVLDAPVTAGSAAQFLRAAPTTADVIGNLETFLLALPPRPGHADD